MFLNINSLYCLTILLLSYYFTARSYIVGVVNKCMFRARNFVPAAGLFSGSVRTRGWEGKTNKGIFFWNCYSCGKQNPNSIIGERVRKK